MRPTEYRIPIPAKSVFVESDDIVVDTRRLGASVSMVIDENVLPEIGAQGIAVAVENLGRHLVRQHLDARMDAICTDRWVMGVVENEIKLVVREFVVALWDAEDIEELHEMMKAIRKGESK